MKRGRYSRRGVGGSSPTGKPATGNALAHAPRAPSPEPRVRPIDRTYKMFIGGKQARPDAPYARKILGVGGRLLGEVGEGNRKDIRDAVEAAHAAAGWAHTTGHNRGQVLYYMAENLAVRAEEFAGQLEAVTGP